MSNREEEVKLVQYVSPLRLPLTLEEMNSMLQAGVRLPNPWPCGLKEKEKNNPS